ncbi:MAG: hypothetical protein VX498_05670, partial [Myxococcota bacterium]|nr:hypothetical protein [Myxococcota bacterium]
MRRAALQLLRAPLLLAVLLGGCSAAPPSSCPEGYWLDEEDLCRLVEVDTGDDWPWGQAEGPCGGEEDPQAWAEPFPRCTNTYEGDLRITSPEDMTVFCADYDCVAGGVDIGATETGRDEDVDSIIDLEPLSCLREARYVFVSEAPNLREIHLPELRRTGGGFSVIANPSLKSLSLPVLGEVGGDLSIQANPLLAEVELPRLHSVLEFLFIV